MNRTIIQLAVFTFCLLPTMDALAEIRTITATGEHRMSSNDTPADAKSLALLDAKRMALEQAGVYIESITQIKNLNLVGDEVRAYTAGIVEVVEQATRTSVEGNVPIVRVDVKVKVDTDVVARQIEALRLDENAKAELTWLRDERTRLLGKIEAQTREMSVLQSDAEIVAVRKQRERLIGNVEANDLLTRATGAFKASIRWPTSVSGKAKVVPEGMSETRNLIDQGLLLDPLHPIGHILLGGIYLHIDKNYAAAIREFRTVLRVAPDYGLPDDQIGSVHSMLGDALAKTGDHGAAIQEYRISTRLNPHDPMPHLGLAVTLMKLKAPKEEEAFELREYLRLVPDSHHALEDAVKDQVRARLHVLEQ